MFKEMVRLLPPRALKAELPVSEAANATVVRGRQAVNNILAQKDERLLIVAGPCSIHDTAGALEYASKLNALRPGVSARASRSSCVSISKSPARLLDGKVDQRPAPRQHLRHRRGPEKARRLLLEITGMGMPAATEFLDPIIPQYIADLVAGRGRARTTSPKPIAKWPAAFRCPSVSKNGTDGSLQIAIDAMGAADAPA